MPRKDKNAAGKQMGLSMLMFVIVFYSITGVNHDANELNIIAQNVLHEQPVHYHHGEHAHNYYHSGKRSSGATIRIETVAAVASTAAPASQSTVSSMSNITSLIITRDYPLQKYPNRSIVRIVKLDRNVRTAGRRRRLALTNGEWSPANIELIHAALKVAILVSLKIAVKYYFIGPFKNLKDSGPLPIIVDISSKALTIAITKYAMKLALYPALRTAIKTMLIACIKSLSKPLSTCLKQTPKADHWASMAGRFVLMLSVKTIIKIVALSILLIAFESEAGQMPIHDLIVRVSTILCVKMAGKRLCKQYIKRHADLKNDKLTVFAIKKLVTKLIKIPLIKFLF